MGQFTFTRKKKHTPSTAHSTAAGRAAPAAHAGEGVIAGTPAGNDSRIIILSLQPVFFYSFDV